MFQHPDIARALAEECRRGLIETAAAGSRAALSDEPVSSQPVLIRQSTARDASGLARLAGLDSRTLPGGRFLVADVDGELVVAVPLDVDEAPLADPFRPTEKIRRLVEQQAEGFRISGRMPWSPRRLELRRAA